MAGDKKKESAPGAPDQTEMLVILVFAVLVGGVVIERINSFLAGDTPIKNVPQNFYERFLEMAPLLQGLSITISAIFLMCILTLGRKIGKIRRVQREALYENGQTEVAGSVPEKIVNKKWERVLMHANSNNPSDWRLAIIEADIMLDELLDVQGYKGDTIGDKLKSIEKSDFLTLDQAWDAHKVRNLIAHEGSNFVLTEREARRVIALYQAVFEEFKFI